MCTWQLTACVVNADINISQKTLAPLKSVHLIIGGDFVSVSSVAVFFFPFTVHLKTIKNKYAITVIPTLDGKYQDCTDLPEKQLFTHLPEGSWHSRVFLSKKHRLFSNNVRRCRRTVLGRAIPNVHN